MSAETAETVVPAKLVKIGDAIQIGLNRWAKVTDCWQYGPDGNIGVNTDQSWYTLTIPRTSMVTVRPRA